MTSICKADDCIAKTEDEMQDEQDFIDKQDEIDKQNGIVKQVETDKQVEADMQGENAITIRILTKGLDAAKGS